MDFEKYVNEHYSHHSDTLRALMVIDFTKVWNAALEEAAKSVCHEDCHVVEGHCGIHPIKKQILSLKK